jgi:MYXO-CTERM domain-containing protein
MLDPNESVAFSVGFHPTSVGTVSETLRITSPQLPGEPLEVMLIGTGGTGDPLPPDAGVGPVIREKTTFYACACSTPGAPWGGWPLPMAVAFLIARRRRGSSSSR